MAPGRPVRRLAVAGVLTALIGVWVSHTVEYARTMGLGRSGSGLAAPVHLYMVPTAAILTLCATLGAARLWRAWVALSWRIARTRAGIEAAWRGLRTSHLPFDHGRPPSFGSRLVALWLPLAAVQVALYLLQENLEARWSGLPMPGFDPVTGVHWAAPLVHLAVALVLASAAAAVLALFRRRECAVVLSERLLRVLLRVLVARRVPVDPARSWTPSPVDRFGTRILSRPPPPPALR
ncbi:MAG TPA: hypothetical protein VH134_13540 [Candidatus Dormibacteraeota bacterium]|nr:hypothetical protein [Candidatus Dormibacteraeota bacterium]